MRYSYQYLKRIAEEFAVKHRGGSLSKISSIIQSVTQGGPSNSEMGSTSGNVECDGKHVENTNAQVLLMMSQIEKTYLEGMQVCRHSGMLVVGFPSALPVYGLYTHIYCLSA